MAEHEPSIGATSEWFTPPEYFGAPTSPSHGENRGSSPLGSASKINVFAQRGGARPPLKRPFQEGHRLVKRVRATLFKADGGLITVGEHGLGTVGNYVLTPYGRGFLKYIVDRRLSVNKPF